MRLIFTIFSFALFLSSCAPRYQQYLSLIPKDQELTDRKTIQIQQGVQLEVAYLTSNEFDLVFNVSVQNNSNTAIQITPEDFFYTALTEDQDVMTRERAFNPDELVFEIEESIKASRKTDREAKILGWLFFGINAIGAVSAFANDNEALGIDYTVDAAIGLTGNVIEANIAQKHLVRLEAERDFYDYSAIRDTILRPGQEVEGLVVFPRYDPAYQLDVKFPIERREFLISYDQFYETIELERR